MNLTRRDFFLRSAALAVPAIVPLASLMPVVAVAPKLWGDGIHDDSAALQWMIDRSSRACPATLHGGVYRVERTLTVVARRAIDFHSSTFLGRCNGHTLDVRDGATGTVAHCSFLGIIGSAVVSGPQAGIRVA